MSDLPTFSPLAPYEERHLTVEPFPMALGAERDFRIPGIGRINFGDTVNLSSGEIEFAAVRANTTVDGDR